MLPIDVAWKDHNSLVVWVFIFHKCHKRSSTVFKAGVHWTSMQKWEFVENRSCGKLQKNEVLKAAELLKAEVLKEEEEEMEVLLTTKAH